MQHYQDWPVGGAARRGQRPRLGSTRVRPAVRAAAPLPGRPVRTPGLQAPAVLGPMLPARMVLGLLLLAVGLFALPGAARAERLPPMIEALTAPLSDSELAGVGCLVGTAVAGGTVLALAGGTGAVAAAVQGPLPPQRVLEGGAALAFLASSACYVGQALAPVVMLGWTTLTDLLTPVATPVTAGPGPVASGR